MTTADHRPLTGRRILVTDGDERAALAIVRSLGKAGAVLHVCSTSGRSLAGASRFAAVDLPIVSPLESPDGYVDALAGIVRDQAIECLLPVTEASLRPVLRSRDRLFPGPILPFAPHDMFARASDKQGVMELAASLGVPVPRQATLRSPDMGAQPEVWDLRTPVVLKPSTSVAGNGLRAVKLSVRHVSDHDSLERSIADLPPEAFPLLVQERINGDGIGIFLLRWEGCILARFAHRRLREKPPSGGVSVYRESIAPPAAALRHAEALLDALDWEGVAMVEFKTDAGTGVPYLMEINGRFWGSLQLAIDAGVDFPRLLVEAAFGKATGQAVEGLEGIRLRWLLGDLDHLLLRLRKAPEELDLGRDAPGRLRVLASFLLPWRPNERWEVLRPSDPRPFGRELRQWISDVLRAG